jgi:hypothetical protein
MRSNLPHDNATVKEGDSEYAQRRRCTCYVGLENLQSESEASEESQHVAVSQESRMAFGLFKSLQLAYIIQTPPPISFMPSSKLFQKLQPISVVQSRLVIILLIMT